MNWIKNSPRFIKSIYSRAQLFTLDSIIDPSGKNTIFDPAEKNTNQYSMDKYREINNAIQ